MNIIVVLLPETLIVLFVVLRTFFTALYFLLHTGLCVLYTIIMYVEPIKRA